MRSRSGWCASWCQRRGVRCVSISRRDPRNVRHEKGSDLPASKRHFRGVLRGKRYGVRYGEATGGKSISIGGAGFARELLALAGRRALADLAVPGAGAERHPAAVASGRPVTRSMTTSDQTTPEVARSVVIGQKDAGTTEARCKRSPKVRRSGRPLRRIAPQPQRLSQIVQSHQRNR